MAGEGVFLHVAPKSCKNITLGFDHVTAKVTVCVYGYVCVSDKWYVKQNNYVCVALLTLDNLLL